MIWSALPILADFAAAAAAVAAAAPSTGPAPDAEIKSAAERLAPALVETRRDIHRHPELGNRETRTGQLVAERLKALGLEVRYPVAKTGVVGVLKGGRAGPTVALRADLDALPIQEVNEVPYKSQNPGVKHACGHDAHTTIVLGTAEVLSRMKDRLPGTVVFLFQPSEEGPPEGEEGGAALMLKEGVFDSPRIQAIYGLHMDGHLDAGQVGWRAGPISAASDHFGIEVKGKKAHGAYPHEGLDPIPVAAEIVSALQLVVSRQIDARDPHVLTIGTIRGGSRYNIIADSVAMEGTLRTLDPEVRKQMLDRIGRTVKGVAEAHGTTATLRLIGTANPVLINDAALTRASIPSLERVYGKDRVIEVKAQMGAEDFALYAQKVPALYLRIGVRNVAKGFSSQIHMADFDIDESVLPLGVRAMSTLLWDFLARAK
jgi:amidohydrolase